MFRSSSALVADATAVAIPPSRDASILAGLTPAQAEAARLEGPVLVLAGAGTGKIKTLTSGVAWRIEARGIPPSRILAVTFTNKAAGEMSVRIRTMLTGQEVPSWCGTFHGLGARQLRAEPEMAGLRSGFDILDAVDSKRLVKRVLKAMAVDPAELGSDRDPVKLVCRQIGQFKDDLVTPEEAPARVEARIAEAHLVRRPVDPDSLRLVARVMPSTSAGCARRTRPTSATCCCGRRWPCSATLPTGSGGPDASTACWPTSIRTCATPSSRGCGCSRPGTARSSSWETTTSRCMGFEARTSSISAASRTTSRGPGRGGWKTISAPPGTSWPPPMP